ncbi:MAG TPA: DUF4252 domain-containing protein [Puia sp.]|nr:DUF4252 domain-containing protein [Puia sp.]
MQKFLLPLALLMISLSACSQDSHLDKFFQKHQNGSGSGFHISCNSGSASGTAGTSTDGSASFLLNASFSGKSSGKSSSTEAWMSKISSLRLIVLDGKRNPDADKDWKDLESCLRDDHFDELMSIHKGKERMRLLSKDVNEGLKEIAFLVAGKEDSGLFFHFRGHFTEKDLTAMQNFLQSHDCQ